jgi:hypothetical protein
MKRPAALRIPRFLIPIAFLAATLFLPQQAFGLACTWDGSSSTNWATAANWSNCGGAAPGQFDTATINSGGNQPSVSTAATIGQITTGAGAALTVASGGALTLTNGLTGGGNLTVASGGTLNWNSGAMDGAGTSALQAGGTLNLSSSYGTLQRTMTLAGTTNISAGYFYILTGGTLSNSGTMNVQVNSYFVYGGATTTFTNTGTLNRTVGSGTATMYNVTFVNSGTVSVQSGTVDFSTTGSATHTGSFNVSASAVLQFSSNATNTFSGAFTGAGTVAFAASGTQTLTGTYSPGATTISNGTVNFNQASTQSLANLTLTSGALSGSANVNLTGAADLNSGTMSGAGTVTFPNGSTTTLDSSYILVTRPLVNAGTINFLSTAYFYFQAGGSFTNQSTGVIDIQNNYYGFYGDGNTPINNTGTVKRTTSAGVASITNAKFMNTSPGTVSVQSGTLDISIPSAATQTGAFNVAAGSVLQFSGSGTNTVSGAINGDGAVTFGGSGATNLTGTYGIDNTTVQGGTVNFNQGSAQTLQNLTMNSGTLAGSAAINITGVGDFNSGTLAGSGVFTLVNGADVTMDSSYITIQRPFVNQTLMTLLGNAYLYITGGSLSNQATGTIEIQNNTYGIYGSSLQAFNNAGTVSRTTSSGTTSIYYLTITNTGTFSVQSGVLSMQSCVFNQTAGAFHVDGGNLEVTGSPGVLNIQGGLFDGSGSVNGNIAVSGTGQFNPGTSPGEISITNNHTYTQTNPGVLNVDVNGTTAGFDYDRILISGAATLGGELKVTLGGGFTPALNDSFTILEHASRTGTFNKLTFPSPGAGRGWDIAYSATQTKLTISELKGAFLLVDANAGTGTSSDGNGVLEAGERVVVEPNWLNLTDSSIASSGTASDVAGPAGATYTLNDTTAAYGTAAPNATTSCYTATGDCFQASVSDPAVRPAVHWDASFKETLTGGSNRTWKLHVGESFTDVPTGHTYYRRIETLFHTGITTGCTTTTYCPSQSVTRGQMATFVARALTGGGGIPVSGTIGGFPYNCVSGGESAFEDVPPTDPYCRPIHYIASQNVTSGTSATRYSPNDQIRRDHMASFIAKAIVAPAGGVGVPAAYGPDPVTNLSYNCNGGPVKFTDVPAYSTFCKHVHFLWARGFISGASPTTFIPSGLVTRGEMARFLGTSFNLLLYGPVP